MPDAVVAFGPYRIDPVGARLWRGRARVPLQPQPLAVLAYLARRPGEVVSRDELIATLWAGTFVTKGVLKVAVRAIRSALDDDAEAPRYVETVGREGYRFIRQRSADEEAGNSPAVADVPLVGRAPELDALEAAFGAVADGHRRLVLVTGEAGIGKTTLIDHFTAQLAREGRARLARGQCLEQCAEGEAYLPVLEAIGRLAAGDETGELADVLRRHAPTWVQQLPALTTRERAQVRPQPAIRTMPTRMLREMADALEAFTQRRPLVLVLEDLHWSDHATVDLLGCIARRRQGARLLVLGTLRPAELIVRDHPLRGVQQELLAQQGCRELALEPFSRDEVAAWVDARLGGGASDEMRRLATCVHEKTDGNALFVVNMVTDLMARGLLLHRDGRWWVTGSIEDATEHVPTGLQELIARRLGRLADGEHRVLEAASVAGDEFAVASVAAALEEDVRVVEDVCEHLATTGVAIAAADIAEWPDGTISGRYRFLHGLYRRVLYERIAPTRRVRLHRAVGLREEAGFAGLAAERAPHLAMHFTRGRELGRALAQHELAAAAAVDRHAPHEAVAHFGAALDALFGLAAGAQRDARELDLVVAQATLLMATRGYAAAETERAFARARALCAALPVGPAHYPVLRGLVSYHHVRAHFPEALEVGGVLLQHARADSDDRELGVQAHYAQGATLFHVGQLEPARRELEAGLADYVPETHRTHLRIYGGYDPGVGCSLWLAWTLALAGHLAEAEARDREGLALARRLGDAFSLAWACQAAAVTRQVFGDWAASETLAAEAARLADDCGFPHVLGMAMVNRGWALIMLGNPPVGIPLLREGIAVVDATGAAIVRASYLGMLAAADLMEGRREAAARRFDEGLAEIARRGERIHEGALLIGKSHLLANGADGAAEAEACLRRALEVTQAQGARLLELRAAVALARHCRKRGRGKEGRAILENALGWFADQPPAAPEIAVARRLVADAGT